MPQNRGIAMFWFQKVCEFDVLGPPLDTAQRTLVWGHSAQLSTPCLPPLKCDIGLRELAPTWAKLAGLPLECDMGPGPGNGPGRRWGRHEGPRRPLIALMAPS